MTKQEERYVSYSLVLGIIMLLSLIAAQLVK